MGLTLLRNLVYQKFFGLMRFSLLYLSLIVYQPRFLIFLLYLNVLFTFPLNFSYFWSFSCQCFPHLRPYILDKLSYCSKPCLFIGYYSNHRGFHYLIILLGVSIFPRMWYSTKLCSLLVYNPLSLTLTAPWTPQVILNLYLYLLHHIFSPLPLHPSMLSYHLLNYLPFSIHLLSLSQLLPLPIYLPFLTTLTLNTLSLLHLHLLIMLSLGLRLVTFSPIPFLIIIYIILHAILFEHCIQVPSFHSPVPMLKLCLYLSGV